VTASVAGASRASVGAVSMFADSRQHPDRVYAAFAPNRTAAMINDEPVRISGDGKTRWEFRFIATAMKASLRPAESAVH
jgi:nucleoside-diphosphate-sugar epimerase